jgi:hypothetical protein
MIKNILKKIRKYLFCHKWQTRGRNSWYLSTYRVCRVCGLAQERILPAFENNWADCERIKELDDAFVEGET